VALLVLEVHDNGVVRSADNTMTNGYDPLGHPRRVRAAHARHVAAVLINAGTDGLGKISTGERPLSYRLRQLPSQRSAAARVTQRPCNQQPCREGDDTKQRQSRKDEAGDRQSTSAALRRGRWNRRYVPRRNCGERRAIVVLQGGCRSMVRCRGPAQYFTSALLRRLASIHGHFGCIRIRTTTGRA
jgi:hypothetical protein